MSQKDGECHVVHTLMGLTGALPGFSVQAKEGNESFGAAVVERLLPRAIDQVRLLYSDAPSEGMLKYLKNCVGIAEDKLHLVIRAEYCSGGRRTSCSAEILRLQSKFGYPLDVPETSLVGEIMGRRKRRLLGMTCPSLQSGMRRS